MTTYSLDIGFDRNLRPNPGNRDKEALLTPGFTEINVEGNPIATARRLKKESGLKVTLYDLTRWPDSELPKSVDFLSFKITFDRAYDHEHKSPVAGGDAFENFKVYPSPEPQGSTVFEGKSPRFFVVKGGMRFDRNQLQRETKQEVGNAFQLLHKGNYYYTAQLFVRWEGDERLYKFRVDPEMIVDPTGPGGEPES